jgi:hypothetical protein
MPPGFDVALLAASAALPSPGQTLAAFIAALDGQTVDSCGGFPAGQCTALACAWCRNLGLSTPCGSCGAPDHCDGACWQGGGYAGWTWILNGAGAVPSPGDLVCYRANCGADGIGPSGHVDIFVSGNASSFTSFAQNWDGAFCKLVSHGYECVLGWHHPTATPTPTPPTPTPPPPPGSAMSEIIPVLLIGGGLIAGSVYLRHHLHAKPHPGLHLSVDERFGSLGGHYREQRCPCCLGSGIVGEGQPVGRGFKVVHGHGAKRQCPVCKGKGTVAEP